MSCDDFLEPQVPMNSRSKIRVLEDKIKYLEFENERLKIELANEKN